MLEWLEHTVDDVPEDVGDREHLELIWAAYQSVTSGASLRGTSDRRRQFATERLPTLAPTSGARKATLGELRNMLAAIGACMGDAGRQFVVNLILFNYRTANGGRIRKATQMLRRGASDDENDEYLRPFETALPRYVAALLDVVPARDSSTAGLSLSLSISPRMDNVYVPPTRFTATFPLALGKDEVLKTPILPGQMPYTGTEVAYRFLGSFGFAEPSYCYWNANTRSESAGTRLSLGAYALNATYLEHLKSMLSALRGETKMLYAQYGSVGAEHVEALYQKFGPGAKSGWNQGAALAVGWTVQLAKIACAAVTAAKAKVPAGMRPFFELLLRKTNECAADLDFIWETRGAYPSKDRVNDRNRGFNSENVFDRIWVLEAVLWELTFLGATCLSMGELATILKRLTPGWEPSTGAGVSFHQGAGDGTQEEIAIGDLGVVFDRFLFPSGTSAANQVYALLGDLGYKPRAIKVDKKELSTFTPYFEFYQQTTSILSPEGVSALKIPKRAGGQFWMNLSDGLHASLLNTRGESVGATVAKMAAAFIRGVKERVPDPPSPIFIIIDYTKFASDMPNNRVYPILAQMARWLIPLLGEKEVAGVLFLRSNLKYNTGSLDRYQLGEVLVWRHNPVDIAGKFFERTVKALEGDDKAAGEWILRGEYISMAKKVYLLNDAIGSGRWEAYAKHWASGVSTAPMEGPHLPDAEILKLKNTILSFIEMPLAPIFTNLIKDIRARSAPTRHLPQKTKTDVSTLWNRLVKDRDALGAVKSKVDSELELRVRTIAGYLEHDLDQIIGDMADTLTKIPKREGPARKELGTYLARLKAARAKLSLASQVAKIPGAPEIRLAKQSRQQPPERPRFSLMMLDPKWKAEVLAPNKSKSQEGSGKAPSVLSTPSKPPVSKAPVLSTPSKPSVSKAPAPVKGIGRDGSAGSVTSGGRVQERIVRVPCLAQARNTCGQRAAFNALAFDASAGNPVAAAVRMADNVALHNFADMPVDIYDDTVRTLLDNHGGRDIPIIGNIKRMALLFMDQTQIADDGEFALYAFLKGARRRIAVVINTHALLDPTDPSNLQALSTVSHYFAAELFYNDDWEIEIAFADSLVGAASSRLVLEGLLRFLS